MTDLEPALAAIRGEEDPSRRNLRVADSPDYRVGEELRALLSEAEQREAR